MRSLISSVCLPIAILLFCNSCETKKSHLDSFSCAEIAKYPSLFSYSSDKLKNELNGKGITALTEKEKLDYFIRKSTPDQVYDTAFSVFPVNRISYNSGELIIYFVRENQVSSVHELDQLVLVIYNSEGRPMEVLSEILEDPYSSTYEFNFTSRSTFELINTDREYSPDAESEAEDIRNGRIIEPSVMTQHYQIDTVQYKFVSQDK